ncbi:TIGR01244 family sulfur transferase [Celeribacter sp. PS-C1]|uniref:TIGR01244 family sulfur transferase n=1 Tax=Celeribacter sp. PS-C1 TaxID=2820813 RepID=UPI001CA58139|nr:TIGR01244 family sulfur transferase [Celeribacter sp. PS-C1]MBW6417282.1 TIGR01244 family phosphatase [Celeribacter sp. PS-C1]
MEFNKINDQITVSGQITPDEVSILKEKGFKTLICNRPDVEVEPGLASDVLEQAAKEAGLSFAYLPIFPGQFTEELISETARALSELPAPVYAYCRSGTRSTTAWALAQSGQMEPETIISQAADAGYDMTGLRPYLAG